MGTWPNGHVALGAPSSVGARPWERVALKGGRPWDHVALGARSSVGARPWERVALKGARPWEHVALKVIDVICSRGRMAGTDGRPVDMLQ